MWCRSGAYHKKDPHPFIKSGSFSKLPLFNLLWTLTPKPQKYATLSVTAPTWQPHMLVQSKYTLPKLYHILLQPVHTFKHTIYSYFGVQFLVLIIIIRGSIKMLIWPTHKPFNMDIDLSIQTTMLYILGHKLMKTSRKICKDKTPCPDQYPTIQSSNDTLIYPVTEILLIYFWFQHQWNLQPNDYIRF